MSVQILINKLKAIESFNVENETIRILQTYSFVILDLIRSQMAKGKDADGKPIFAKYGPFYADVTVFDKGRRGLQTEYVDLYYTGEFYTTMRLVIKETVFQAVSDLPYFSEIIKRTGPRVMELSPENLRWFQKFILQPQLQIRFKQITNGI